MNDPQTTLGILNLTMMPNVSDTHLSENLHAWKKLNPSHKLCLHPPHQRVLAIAGSGPSLRRTAPGIPADCDLMALNGAYPYLVDRGRVPTYFAMLDARACNENFLRRPHSETAAFFLASQTHMDAVAEVPLSKVVLFHLGTPTTRNVFPNEDFYLGGGGTIGLTALGLGYCLGYRTFILYGFDSSFEDGARHAEHQPQNDALAAIEVWVQDRKYTTTHAMASQVADFFAFRDALIKLDPSVQIHIIGKGLFYDFVSTNNNPATRERELAKYIEAYRHEEYGMSEQRFDGLTRIFSDKSLSRGSLLDVSTGRGELLKIAKDAGFTDVQGTETVDELLGPTVHKGILPNLPVHTKSFDVVSLIEVIEHLLPEDVAPTLYELTRIARKHIIISAAVYPHWYGGVNLHPSARPLEEWDETFKAVWPNVYRVEDLGFSPCWRVDL